MTFPEIVQQVIDLSRAVQMEHSDWALKHNSNSERMVRSEGKM